MEPLSNSMLHFYQNPHQNKPSTTGKILGSLNKTNSTLSGMRYVGYKTASPTSTSWDPLQPHQKYKPLHYPPNQRQQCSTPQGIKSQLPPKVSAWKHKPKASAWKRRRRKAKLFFRVITTDSNRGCHFPVCHVKSRNTKRIKINLITFKQKALNSFTWLYKEENHTLAWI